MERGSLAALIETFAAVPARGEIVVVVGPAPGGPDGAHAAAREGGAGAARTGGTLDPDAAEALALARAAEGLWGRELRAALEGAGVDRDAAYRLAVRHGRRPEPGPGSGSASGPGDG